MKAFPKDIEVQTMTSRHIGVENELGVTGDIVAISREIRKRGLLQSIGYDGGGREFRTNPIDIKTLKQVRGFRYLSEYYGVLKDGTEVLGSGGTHIHISILASDNPNMEANATAMAIAFYEQFQKIAGRKTTWASLRPERSLPAVQSLLDRNKYSQNPRAYYLKGSMLNPTGHQTLEFRGPMGSNDGEEILAWIQFLDNVIKVCNRDSVEGVSFRRLLRGKRISAYVNSLSGWRKLSDKDLNKKFNSERLQAV